MTLNEHNTLFDDVIKNLENYEEIKNVVDEILIAGKQISYNNTKPSSKVKNGINRERKYVSRSVI